MVGRLIRNRAAVGTIGLVDILQTISDPRMRKEGA